MGLHVWLDVLLVGVEAIALLKVIDEVEEELQGADICGIKKPKGELLIKLSMRRRQWPHQAL